MTCCTAVVAAAANMAETPTRQTSEDLSVDNLDDLRIRAIRPLVPSACLIDDIGGLDDAEVVQSIQSARRSLTRCVRGDDGRLIVVVGPASAHDPKAVMEYARKLKAASAPLSDELIVVMRVFLDEPSGGAGYWSGAMYDPAIDGSFQINKGFRDARQLLLDINRLGLPAACLYNDTISPQFVADLVSWACISGRTSSSHLHRELASGLSTPVGFQAGSSSLAAAELAVDAVRASAAPHTFLSVSKQGVAGIVETTGNRDCHVVLPANAESIEHACAKLDALELSARVMVSCADAAAVSRVVSQVSAGGRQVLGALIPSFLQAGAQPLLASDATRKYGMSVTEPCMGWEATLTALQSLAAAVKQRRSKAMPTPSREESVSTYTYAYRSKAMPTPSREESVSTYIYAYRSKAMPAPSREESVSISTRASARLPQVSCTLRSAMRTPDARITPVHTPCVRMHSCTGARCKGVDRVL